MLILAFPLAICLSTAGSMASDEAMDAAFQDMLELAWYYDDDQGADPEVANRDVAVEYYRQALVLRPNHPDNLKWEYRLGQLLLQIDPRNDQKPRREEALEVFEAIVSHYDHAAYYETEPPRMVYAPQVLLPRAAMHTGDLVWMLRQDREAAEAYYFKAIEYLNLTHTWRSQDYANEVPPDYADFTVADVPDERAEERYLGALAEYERRQEALAKGNTFPENGAEMELARTAVMQYAQAHQKDGDLIEAMNGLAAAFPGTPMAELALAIRNRRVHSDNEDDDIAPGIPPESQAQAPIMPQKRDSDEVPTTEARTPAVPDTAPAVPRISAPAPSRPQTGRWARWALPFALAALIAVAGIVFLARKWPKKGSV